MFILIAALVGVIVGILVREGIDVISDWQEDRAFRRETPPINRCRGCYEGDGLWYHAFLGTWYCDACADDRYYSGMTKEV